MQLGPIRKNLNKWYLQYRRNLPWRDTSDPYLIWVSEIMLQQTQVNTVIPYYLRFVGTFPDVQSLAQADLQHVLKMWEGLGYYARARNLHKAAGMVVKKYKGNIPDTWDDFRSLPGVGGYIASAVLSIAFHLPYPVVDGNVKRVLARLLMMDHPVNQPSSYKQFHEKAADLLDHQDPGTFNQALMELGALICKPAKPGCDICPLSSYCLALKGKQVSKFPVRGAKRSVPHHLLAVGVILNNKKVLIVRRPMDGLLGGLWEFPAGTVNTGESPEDACIRSLKEQINLNVKVAGKLASVRHAYTHFKITANVFICKKISGRIKLNGPVQDQWIDLKDLKKYLFPKVNNKFIPMLIEKFSKKL